jgi:hypothetical protein
MLRDCYFKNTPRRIAIMKGNALKQLLQTAIINKLCDTTSDPGALNKTIAFLYDKVLNWSMFSEKLLPLDDATKELVIYAVILFCLCKDDVKSSIYALHMVHAAEPTQPPAINLTAPFDASPEQVLELYERASANAREAWREEMLRHQERINTNLGNITSQIEYHMNEAVHQGDVNPCHENIFLRGLFEHLSTANPDTVTIELFGQQALTL